MTGITLRDIEAIIMRSHHALRGAVASVSSPGTVQLAVLVDSELDRIAVEPAVMTALSHLAHVKARLSGETRFYVASARCIERRSLTTALEHYHPQQVEKLREVMRIAHTILHTVPTGPLWSCHAVARVLNDAIQAMVPGVRTRVADGSCGYSDHSWLVVMIDVDTFILDPYPVASLGTPLLVSVQGGPWSKTYREHALTPSRLVEVDDEHRRLHDLTFAEADSRSGSHKNSNSQADVPHAETTNDPK